MESTVEVRRADGETFSLRIDSDCPMVQALASDLESIELMEIFQPILENRVYREASARLRHATCPVASGVIKAVEVEAGMALPKDARITFEPSGDPDA